MDKPIPFPGGSPKGGRFPSRDLPISAVPRIARICALGLAFDELLDEVCREILALSGAVKVVAITNPIQRGLKTMAMIGVRTDGNRMLEVADQISRFEEVVYLVVASGRFDILAEVFCRDHEDLLRFITEKLYGVEGVRETETFMHLRIVKEIYF